MYKTNLVLGILIICIFLTTLFYWLFLKPPKVHLTTILPNNKLYYQFNCSNTKNDCFYEALKNNNFIMSSNITNACLIIPCSYDNVEKEIIELKNKGMVYNIYNNAVRIFILNNTDLMCCKLTLWKYLKKVYGVEEASNLLPYTWDLTDDTDFEEFEKQYDPNKLYITKNNYQKQQGIKIHNKLDSILTTRKKYVIVQELLQDPYLVSGRKINLRMYVLFIKDSYENIKINVYKDGFMYYTPELFQPNNPLFKNNITTGYIDRQVYVENPLTHQDFREWLDTPTRKLTLIETDIKKNNAEIKLSELVFLQIYKQLGILFKAYKNIVGNETYGVSFQLYGVDVAIDNHLNPLVMEINKGPDLSAKDIRDKELKLNLCTDILSCVGLIPNNNNNNNNNNNFVTIL